MLQGFDTVKETVDLGPAAEIRDEIEQLAWEKLATNLRVEEALISALSLLHGLEIVVFKGPILTKMIYGDLRRRASADNDIWVDWAHAFDALERLLTAGYSAQSGLDPRAAILRVGQVALFHHDQSRPSLDLHAEPFSGRFFRVKAQTLRSHIMMVDVHGIRTQTFMPELAFVHLVAHYIQHHFEEALLVDIAAAWERWSADESIRNGIYELAPATCTMPALVLTLGMARAEQSRSRTSTPPVPTSLISAWERARVACVSRVLGTSLSERTVVRKFLALFLVAPTSLLTGILGATFLDKDDLVSRYGSGQYWLLLLRHLRVTLTG